MISGTQGLTVISIGLIIQISAAVAKIVAVTRFAARFTGNFCYGLSIPYGSLIAHGHSLLDKMRMHRFSG